MRLLVCIWKACFWLLYGPVSSPPASIRYGGCPTCPCSPALVMRAKTLDSQSFLQPSLLPVSQATPPVTIPGSKFTPNGSNFSISWQSPPVTFTGIPVSTKAWQGELSQTDTERVDCGADTRKMELVLQSTTTVSPGLHVVEGGLWLLPPHECRYYRCTPSHLFPEARASFFFKTALFFILSVWVFCLLVCLCATCMQCL